MRKEKLQQVTYNLAATPSNERVWISQIMKKKQRDKTDTDKTKRQREKKRQRHRGQDLPATIMYTKFPK